MELLRKGGGFAVAPKEYPNIEFITSFELACQNLAKGEADNLSGEIIEELSKKKGNHQKATYQKRNGKP